MQAITGVAGEKIRQAALLFGKAKKAIVLYGMGITQHTTGTDNAKTIANLLMLTGNLGRKGTGFSPLRGQNNVQGACDMGALPVFYPGYQRVDNPSVREKFEKAWGKPLSEKPGLTITEMFQAAYEGKLKGLYVMGENPMLSEPDLNHAREAPANRLTNPALDPQAKIPEFKVSSIHAILAVLEQAAEDNKFLTALAENPAGVLSTYDLTPEHRRALMEGDIASIEQWVGPLEERLKIWLKTRLKQERLFEGEALRA